MQKKEEKIASTVWKQKKGDERKRKQKVGARKSEMPLAALNEEYVGMEGFRPGPFFFFFLTASS